MLTAEDRIDAPTLIDIGNAYQNVSDHDRKPPVILAALKKGFPPDDKTDFNRYVIIWGVDLKKLPDPGNTLLAYVADVPTKGGIVLFADAKIGRVTVEEFQTLPKAVSAPLKEEKKP